MFYERSNLTSVTIPSGVTSIGPWAFTEAGLTSVTIPDGVTTIGYLAFAGCFNLASVPIPASVTNIGVAAFGTFINFAATGIYSECASLRAITADAQNSFYSSSNGVLFDKSGSTLVRSRAAWREATRFQARSRMLERRRSPAPPA